MNLDRIIAVRNSKTIYRDGDKCIKLFDSDYSKADVLNEALNQARVEQSGLNVPKVIEVTTVDGKWAIVSEYIKGKDMARLMKEEPGRKDEYLERLVELQLTVQSKTGPLLNQLIDKLDRQIALSELPATTRVDMHNQLMAMPRRNKLCHGDLVPANIIFTEDGAPYILDWSHAAKGCGAADAVLTSLQFRLRGDEEGADRYLELYCEKAGDRREHEDHVRQWTPLVAAAQSVKGGAREREYLLSLVS